LEIRRCYGAVRSRIPTSGVRATLLHVGGERTGVVTGSDVAPEAVLMLDIGSRRTAREHFRHLRPTEAELEGAIATTAGTPAGASTILGLELVEETFGRFVSEALGQAPRSTGFPLDRESAAALLILREFMHHLQFGSINVVLPPMALSASSVTGRNRFGRSCELVPARGIVGGAIRE
jgi:hypothetical protein